jgi:type II secretory pathway component PulJ
MKENNQHNKKNLEIRFKNELNLWNDIRGVIELKKLKKEAQIRNIILDVEYKLREEFNFNNEEIKKLLWDFDDKKISELQKKWTINSVFEKIKSDIESKFNYHSDTRLTTEVAITWLDNIKKNWFRITR